MAENKAEELQPASEEKVEEAPTPPAEEEVQANNGWEQKLNEQRDQYEAKLKDLSARLTRTQQESAELLRFHKSSLPKINKSFEERWEMSPERAVKEEVETGVQPISSELAALRAETAMTKILAANPEWRKYEEQVRTLGYDHPHMTYSEIGIRRLFDMARSDDMEKELQKVRGNARAEQEKTRAFTEGGSPKEKPSQKPRLSAAQRRVAEQLGISEDDYLKQMGV